MKIIIADDNKDNLYVLSLILRDYNHEIQTVKNGLELIENLKKDKYDIILLDIEMPLMNGIQAVTLIRNNEAGPENSGIPILAMTAHSIRERNKYLKYGFSDILIKPINYEKLNEIIQKQFDLWNRQQ
ncbi:MAG: response regulator [Spirochaetes bacterium]|nr:response regulator [Spirochaetota bacterium]